MKDFEDAWRNKQTGRGGNYYIQHCRPSELEPLNPKLFNLIMKYGSCFDDDWEYWIARTGKWMRRTPLGFGKRIAAERPKRYEPNMQLESF